MLGLAGAQAQSPLGSGLLSCSSSVTSAKAVVNGVHLHYLRTGDGERAILLLPGMLGARVPLAGPARCPLLGPRSQMPGLDAQPQRFAEMLSVISAAVNFR